MKAFDLKRLIRLGLVPVACVGLLAGCAYDPVPTYPVVYEPPRTTVPVVSMTDFDRLDTNRDGFLSRAELAPLGAFPGTIATVPAETPANAFHRLDLNRDGFLSRAEAGNMFSTIPGGSFDAIDTNRDGYLSMAEAMPHMQLLYRGTPTAMSFEALDIDRDGFLSRAEAVPLLGHVRWTDNRWIWVAPRVPSASFDTLDLNIECGIDHPLVSLLQPYPLTDINEMTSEMGYATDAWDKFSTKFNRTSPISFENRHELFFGGTYSPSARWGVNLTARALDEQNDRHREVLFRTTTGGVVDEEVPVELDREREQQDLTLGLWATPLSRLSAGLNYGFMRTRIRQDLLFGNDLGNSGAATPVPEFSILDEMVEYSQRVHTVSANAALRVTEELNLRMEGYHIRSFAQFSPDFSVGSPPLDLPASSAVLKELSRLTIRQNVVLRDVTLAVPAGTVKSRTARALGALRAALEADDRSPTLAPQGADR